MERQGTGVIITVREYKERNYAKLQGFRLEKELAEQKYLSQFLEVFVLVGPVETSRVLILSGIRLYK